jgi:hypothetical protein
MEQISRHTLVRAIEAAWWKGLPFANGLSGIEPKLAGSVSKWCEENKVEITNPWRIRDAEDTERATEKRVVVWKDPGSGRARFSLSKQYNPRAYEAAEEIAKRAGWRLLRQ